MFYICLSSSQIFPHVSLQFFVLKTLETGKQRYIPFDLDRELLITHRKVAVRLCDHRREVRSSRCPSTGRREP